MLIIILVIAGLVSAAVGDLTDSQVIFATFVLNGLLGFVQEWNAERALEALNNMLSSRCRVIRSGTERDIETCRLVPGDIVQLDTGDDVPADLRIAQCKSLHVDESALTSESVSVAKTVVRSGNGCIHRHYYDRTSQRTKLAFTSRCVVYDWFLVQFLGLDRYYIDDPAANSGVLRSGLTVRTRYGPTCWQRRDGHRSCRMACLWSG